MEKLILYVCEEKENGTEKKEKEKTHIDPEKYEIYVAFLLPSKAIEKKSNK